MQHLIIDAGLNRTTSYQKFTAIPGELGKLHPLDMESGHRTSKDIRIDIKLCLCVN
jgi:hypothetical protein